MPRVEMHCAQAPAAHWALSTSQTRPLCSTATQALQSPAVGPGTAKSLAAVVVDWVQSLGDVKGDTLVWVCEGANYTHAYQDLAVGMRRT